MKNTDYTLKEYTKSNTKLLIGNIEFRLVDLSESYRKKWTLTPNEDDFGVLVLDGEIIGNNLYRIGGLFSVNRNDKYMILLLQEEAHYSKEIMKMSKSTGSNNHLVNQTCIVNDKGVVMSVFRTLSYPYIIGGTIYSLNKKYYNIETNELICEGDSIQSKDFIFVESRYNNNTELRGVYQINISNGTYVMYPPRK